MTSVARSARLAMAASAVLAGTVMAASSQTTSPPVTVVGTAASAALMGNTIQGTTADGPYSEFYAPDGRVVHFDGEGREEGRWNLKGISLCLVFPTDPDEHMDCRRIEVTGPRGAFVDTDGSRYPFEILPGNAKQL